VRKKERDGERKREKERKMKERKKKNAIERRKKERKRERSWGCWRGGGGTTGEHTIHIRRGLRAFRLKYFWWWRGK